MLEIDDDDARLLATVKKLGGMTALDQMYRAHTLHTTLHNDPNVRADYEKIIKVKYPHATTASDIAAPYVKRLDETNARLAALEEERVKEKNEALQAQRQADFDAKWSQTVKDHSMTQEGEEALGKFMEKEKLYDPEAAALLYFKRNPKAASPQGGSGITPQTWGIGPLPGEDADSSKLLMDNPEAWADHEAANILNEVRTPTS
jgi:hypothetical protein